MLDHRDDATGQQALADGTAERGDHFRCRAVSAVADDVMGVGNRYVDHRRAIHIDPERDEIGGHQPGIDSRRL